jgi:hypothetical protein
VREIEDFVSLWVLEMEMRKVGGKGEKCSEGGRKGLNWILIEEFVKGYQMDLLRLFISFDILGMSWRFKGHFMGLMKTQGIFAGSDEVSRDIFGV